MSRVTKHAYDLSDAEKRDLIALIQQGKPPAGEVPLPLFQDKQGLMAWNGKP